MDKSLWEHSYTCSLEDGWADLIRQLADPGVESIKRDAVIHAMPTRKQPSRVQEAPRETPSELDLPLTQ